MLKSVEQTPAAASPDFAAIKQKQQATWGSGNYAVVGTTLQIVGETLCEALDLGPTLLALAGLKPAVGMRGRDLFQCQERQNPGHRARR